MNAKRSKSWFVLFDGRNLKELARLSVDGVFPGDIVNARRLLSYEMNIPLADIRLKLE